MSTETFAGILLVALPVAFNVAFGLLATRFDYPDILRLPTTQVLERFQKEGPGLLILWWFFAMTAVVLAPAVVLLSASLTGADGALLTTTTVVGVLAATVQFLGLIRWPFLVPYLARTATDPSATPAQRETVDIVFQSFHRYLGVAVGEHLGYGLTGAWSVLAGIAMTQSSEVPASLGYIGIVAGAMLIICAREFLGRYELEGWAVAGRLTPLAYVLWSLWLVATGLVLLF
jgi:hypothetical protein